MQVRGGPGKRLFYSLSRKDSQRPNPENGKDVIVILGGEVISVTVEESGAGEVSAEAAGIDPGNGKDWVDNRGTIRAKAKATAEEDSEGAKAESFAAGIAAGNGKDGIVNAGTIETGAEAVAKAVDFSLEPLGIDAGGVGVQAQASAVGIDGGNGKDALHNNRGSISVTATSDAQAVNGSISPVHLWGNDAQVLSTAQATGIAGGNGKDAIHNSGTIGATSKADAVTDSVLATGIGFGDFSMPAASTARSTGIDAGKGSDRIGNSGGITALAESTAGSVNVSISLLRMEVLYDSEAQTKAESFATGIAGGAGNDKIENQAAGSISATANAKAYTTDITLSLIGSSQANASTLSQASATGIDGGDGKDRVTNAGAVTVNAKGETVTVSVDVVHSGISLDPIEWLGANFGDARTEAQATGRGIAGGEGDDKITHTGTIDVYANGKARSYGISAEIGIGPSTDSAPQVSAAIPGTVSTLAAGAVPRGPELSCAEEGGGDDEIVNTGTIARANAVGISGGAGNDAIVSQGRISAKAEAESYSLSVDASLSLERTEVIDLLFGISLADSSTTTQASVTGIEGGTGEDKIQNSGELTAEAIAKATSTSVKAHFQGDFSDEGGLEYEIGTALLKSETQANAGAVGIAGGDGDDVLLNSGKSVTKATAEAKSVTVAASLLGAGKGLVGGASYADSQTTAEATAVGMEGGAGKDAIGNLSPGRIEVTAAPTATSTDVGVTVEGIWKGKGIGAGVALTDGTTKAIAGATGISGGEDDDRIANSGVLVVKATPTANSTKVSVGLVGTAGDKGLMAGFSYADAETTAQATAAGLEGGAGNDILANQAWVDENGVTRYGSLEVTAEPKSGSVQVGVTVTGAFTQEWNALIGGAITDGTTKAIAGATGISGGEGEDTILNSGTITVKALPKADSVGVSVDLAGAGNGLTLGFTYADGTTTAEATAVGIDGGTGKDILVNKAGLDDKGVLHSGSVDVTADPVAKSTSVAVTVSGLTKGGISGGAAITVGTTEARSTAAGIGGGDGDDKIVNSGKVAVRTSPDATSTKVSVEIGVAGGEMGLVGGVSYADAETTAEANAAGIDGGKGNDKIVNTGTVEVTAQPASTSAQVGVTGHGVFGTGAAVGIAITDGTTNAVAGATGIRGGDGDDLIFNSGKITAKALPEADAASVSVTFAAAKEGVAAGGAFADGTTKAEATATGIEGGEGNDLIIHSGEKIEAAAEASSSSASVVVSAQGVFQAGAALGVAITDGETKALSIRLGDHRRRRKRPDRQHGRDQRHSQLECPQRQRDREPRIRQDGACGRGLLSGWNDHSRSDRQGNRRRERQRLHPECGTSDGYLPIHHQDRQRFGKGRCCRGRGCRGGGPCGRQDDRQGYLPGDRGRGRSGPHCQPGEDDGEGRSGSHCRQRCRGSGGNGNGPCRRGLPVRRGKQNRNPGHRDQRRERKRRHFQCQGHWRHGRLQEHPHKRFREGRLFPLRVVRRGRAGRRRKQRVGRGAGHRGRGGGRHHSQQVQPVGNGPHDGEHQLRGRGHRTGPLRRLRGFGDRCLHRSQCLRLGHPRGRRGRLD